MWTLKKLRSFRTILMIIIAVLFGVSVIALIFNLLYLALFILIDIFALIILREVLGTKMNFIIFEDDLVYLVENNFGKFL
jgi:hypothetical protein